MNTLEKPLANMAITDDVLNTKGAAEYLKVSKQLLDLMRLRGDGPIYCKLGRLVRYRRADLNAWLVAHRCTSTSNLSRDCGKTSYR
jgi:predicted DNA-binding transcriptional regulator AlpA